MGVTRRSVSWGVVVAALVLLAIDVATCATSGLPWVDRRPAREASTSPAAPDVPSAARPRAEQPRAAVDPPPATPPAADAAPGNVVVPVVGEDGAPYPGALVWERGAGPSHRSPTTGRDGTARLNLAPGRHTIAARGRATGTTSSEIDVPTGPDAFRAPALKLGPGGVIRGRVVDEGAKPLPWIRVRCWQENGDESEVTEAMRHGLRFILGGDDVVTDERGEFALRGLAAEPHKVYVDLLMNATLRAAKKEFTDVRPGGDPIEFRLVPFATVDGQVVDAHTKAPILRFTMTGAEIRAADGRFRAAAGPGADEVLRIEIAARGYVTAERTFPEAKEGDLVHAGVVELEPDPDTGTLVLEAVDASGTPVSGWRVQGVGGDFRMWTETCDAPAIVVRAEGVRAGEQSWWIIGDGISVADGASSVTPSGETPVRVVVTRCGSVRVRLLGGDGLPLRYVEADVIDGGGNPRPFRFVYTRPQGTLMPITDWYGKGPFNLSEADGRLCGLPPATYTLRIKDKAGTRELTVRVPESGETVLDADAPR